MPSSFDAFPAGEYLNGNGTDSFGLGNNLDSLRQELLGNDNNQSIVQQLQGMGAGQLGGMVGQDEQSMSNNPIAQGLAGVTQYIPDITVSRAVTIIIGILIFAAGVFALIGRSETVQEVARTSAVAA
jgi:hypothetical protein